MENVTTKVNGNQLTITIDLTHKGNPSKSGKTTRVASTEGFVPVPEHPDMMLSVNVNKRH